MAAFRFSLASALAKRRGELERAEASRQRAAAALEQQRRRVADLQERLQLAALRQRAARQALAEPGTDVVDAMVELAQCGRWHAAIAALGRLRGELELAQREVLRRTEQLHLCAADEARCNAAVRALDALAEQERRAFLRARERRADAQRLDDALLRWQPGAARGSDD